MAKLQISAGKSISYGDCVVTSIENSKNPDWKIVRLQQETTTEYEGNGENSNFLLNNMLGGNTPLSYKDTRKNTTSIKASVANQLAVGQVVPGVFINRILHSSPQWEGHEAAANGFYYTSILEAEMKQDRKAEATVATKEAVKEATKPAVSSMEIAS
jgi:hypothetical protein